MKDYSLRAVQEFKLKALHYANTIEIFNYIMHVCSIILKEL